MNEEKTNLTPEILKTEKAPSMFNPKILMIGLPIFIVQLVAVYFITANILMPGSNSGTTKAESKSETQTEGTSGEHSGKSEDGKTSIRGTGGVIFSVEDMIVNPAQTNGKMLLLASLGLSVESEESKKVLEEKQVVVKDAILSVLSSKNVNQLGSATYRDTLKTEILKNLAVEIPDTKVNNIYFSKFIIQ